MEVVNYRYTYDGVSEEDEDEYSFSTSSGKEQTFSGEELDKHCPHLRDYLDHFEGRIHFLFSTVLIAVSAYSLTIFLLNFAFSLLTTIIDDAQFKIKEMEDEVIGIETPTSVKIKIKDCAPFSKGASATQR